MRSTFRQYRLISYTFLTLEQPRTRGARVGPPKWGLDPGPNRLGRNGFGPRETLQVVEGEEPQREGDGGDGDSGHALRCRHLRQKPTYQQYYLTLWKRKLAAPGASSPNSCYQPPDDVIG